MKTVLKFVGIAALCSVMLVGFSEMLRLVSPKIADSLLKVALLTSLGVAYQMCRSSGNGTNP